RRRKDCRNEIARYHRRPAESLGIYFEIEFRYQAGNLLSAAGGARRGRRADGGAQWSGKHSVLVFVCLGEDMNSHRMATISRLGFTAMLLAFSGSVWRLTAQT